MAVTTRTPKATRQSSYQGKTQRSQTSNHLTDPARLKHIYNTLTKAIAAAPQGEFQSWDDVKAYVEDFSRATGKAPIAMELCDRDGDVRGFRFYLEQCPAERTSGSYLIKNLKAAGADLPVDDNYFTPSSLAAVLGLESEQAPLDLDADEFIVDGDATDATGDVNLDDDLTVQPSQTRIVQPVAQASGEKLGLIDEAIADDDLISPSSKKTAQKSAPKPRQSSRPTARQEEPIESSVLEAANRATQGLANGGGATVDGLNVAGGTGQLATSTIAVAIALAKALDDPDQRRQARLKRLADLTMRQAQRLDDLSERAEVLSLPPEAPEPTSDEVSPAVTEPFIEATNTLTNKTNQLSQKLDPVLNSLEPLELNRQAAVDEQITQIENYLKQLSKRLDRLEEAMTRLEEQFAQLQSPPQEMQSEVLEPEDSINLSQPNTDVLNAVDALVDEQPRAFTSDEPEPDDNQSRCAASLWGYAQILQSSGEDSEIPLSDSKTLWVDVQGNSTRLLVSDANLNDIWFEAEKFNSGQWQVHYNELSEDDRQAILNLPQTPARYAQIAAAQGVVEAFQQQVTFGDRPVSFAWADGDGNPKYEFEVTEPRSDGSRLLTGYGVGSNNQVLTATLAANKPPQIQQCEISHDEMESLLRDLTPEPEQISQDKQLEQTPQRDQKQRQLKRPRQPEL
ncbi:hypothetical protein ACKFKF_09875 [Phormidesmis sp. 146-12]